MTLINICPVLFADLTARSIHRLYRLTCGMCFHAKIYDCQVFLEFEQKVPTQSPLVEKVKIAISIRESDDVQRPLIGIRRK